jgi:molybdopterin-containing oxidoreductase family iron-sulfur binding subunit
MDLSAIRRRLAGLEGRAYWRSLEELAGTEDFQQYLRHEFPEQASSFTDPLARRQFLKLMGASLALAGVGACTKQPPEQIVPYVKAPEEVVPGKPLFFATAMPLGGFAYPVLVENHMGRPTKVEGNPEHPASLGAANVFAQASVLDLYDPDRAQAITFRGEVRPWTQFIGAMQSLAAAQRTKAGAGLRILTETVTSPSLHEQLQALLADLPQARWHQHEPAGRDNARAGARAAFGRVLDCHYRFDRADVILSLDADFLSVGPGHVRYARDFADRRRIAANQNTMSRLYVVGSLATNTGAKADHRLPLRASDVDGFARAVAAALGVSGGSTPASLPVEVRERWVRAIANDLKAHAGRALVVAGEHQGPAVHALAHAMNVALGNAGTTVVYTEPVEPNPVDQLSSLRELVDDMQAGKVELLIILGSNPVYSAPADLRFADALNKVGVAVLVSQQQDETAPLCHWHIPEAHYLETWGDGRAYDGTVTIMQPLIAPLYHGKSAHEVLAAFSKQPDRTAHDIVKDYWLRAFKGATTVAWTLTDQDGRGFADPELFWRTALHDGFIASTALAAIQPPALQPPGPPPPVPAPDTVDLVFTPDPTVHDGRFANNGWLQELAKPRTKLTWDNAAHISPRLAEARRLSNGDIVELHVGARVLRAPVWIVPGQAERSVSLALGYGRLVGGVAHGAGVSAYALRTTVSPWIAPGIDLIATGDRAELATTQSHFLMEGRAIVRHGTLAEYREHPEFVREMGEAPPRGLTLYPEYEYKGCKWGMAIDLSACNGCNACVVACQAENNIPVVGKEQVAKGREMHWIRVATYYTGDLDNPETFNQPVPCMQCENAPCEPVCPVGATVHSAEGLNDMVYNRCVGTRYCSNNCPYKVRRFNFLLYSDFTTPQLELQRNPDVSVRSRGVMEKCTYCVQRINQARIEAEKEDRPIRDGEIVTACQQTCPAQAIVFGDLNDPNSRVSRLRAEDRNYGILEELNTRPRTTYLAALRNPNPELES